MKLTINGSEREVSPPANLADLLDALGLPSDRPGTAVARNGEVVPRSRWRETAVAEGDKLEIISAVQGG